MACSIHPWMNGYLVLRGNPYMAKSDEDGRLTITNLPAGEHVFQVWHERCGYLRDVRFGPLATDARGRLTITIREGENNLGELLVSPTLFERKN